MRRKKRILVSAYHEIGHYLLIRKFLKDFDVDGYVEKIELCPKKFRRKGGVLKFLTNFDFEANVEMSYGWISILIAGFVAAKLACGFSYDSLELVHHNDYIDANYYACLLSEELQKFPEEILRDCETDVKSYLVEKKSVLDEISAMLLKKRFLTKNDLTLFEQKYSL